MGSLLSYIAHVTFQDHLAFVTNRAKGTADVARLTRRAGPAHHGNGAPAAGLGPWRRVPPSAAGPWTASPRRPRRPRRTPAPAPARAVAAGSAAQAPRPRTAARWSACAPW